LLAAECSFAATVKTTAMLMRRIVEVHTTEAIQSINASSIWLRTCASVRPLRTST
jgi:hypothetical protein